MGASIESVESDPGQTVFRINYVGTGSTGERIAVVIGFNQRNNAYEVATMGRYKAVGEDPLCAGYIGGLCVRCTGRNYIANGRCQPVSSLCDRFSEVTGKCLSCADMRNILTSDGDCVPVMTQMNCKVPLLDNGCLVCNDGYYLDERGNCLMLKPNCLTAEKNGVCTTCNQGFVLSNENCLRLN